jgi:hydroxypyruvate isomerase
MNISCGFHQSLALKKLNYILMKRKDALKTILLTATAITSGTAVFGKNNLIQKNSPVLKGNINHSVCRWCFNKMSLEELCREAKAIGIKAIDLVSPADWKTLFNNGLECSMASGEKINLRNGFNNPDLHGELRKAYSDLIVKAADNGIKNVICFSGDRKGISDEQGLENCAVGIEPLIKLAEKHRIILAMELLNSKVNHPDYQCDRTEWGVTLCKKIGSDNFKLLYDIYHMQIMEGDIIATIKKHHQWISHYHTAGVPGRHELDDKQELFYPAIMNAIKDTGFKGYVAQEFIPTAKDPLASLREAIAVCDV